MKDSNGPFGLDLRQVPAAFQIGNLALGAVEALDNGRAENRIRQYNRALSYLDTSIRDVDRTLAEMRNGQKPDWSAVALQASTQVDAAMSILRTMGHSGLGKMAFLSDFDIPIPTGGSEVGTGPTTAMMVQGTTQPSAWSDGGPQLNSVAVRLREVKEIVRRMRDAEAGSLLQRKAAGGLSGLGAASQPGGPSFGFYLNLALIAGCAYHGYKRNETVGGALKWAAWPFFLGYVGGGVALAVAVAQGFGKPTQRG